MIGADSLGIVVDHNRLEVVLIERLCRVYTAPVKFNGGTYSICPAAKHNYLFLLAGFNNTAFYPSTYDLQSSLTIMNSSSSHYTLTAMSYVSLLVPFVLAYIVYAWWSINKKPITKEEMEEDGHAY